MWVVFVWVSRRWCFVVRAGPYSLEGWTQGERQCEKWCSRNEIRRVGCVGRRACRGVVRASVPMVVIRRVVLGLQCALTVFVVVGRRVGIKMRTTWP